MLSQLTTLSWSRPLVGPTGTSVDKPRAVLVIGTSNDGGAATGLAGFDDSIGRKLSLVGFLVIP